MGVRLPALILAIGCVLLGFAAPGGVGSASAATGAERAAALDSALSQGRTSTGTPGVSAAVVQRGRLVWEGAAGTTLFAGGQPVTPRTLFITASAGKSVAAATALQLVDQRRLRLGQSVAGLLPRLRGGGAITIRNLLQHSSGLPDYLDSPKINRIYNRDPLHRWSRGEVLRAIGCPTFAPGAHSVYSNSNYIALGGVVEARLGIGFERAFRRLVGRPLGLVETTYRYGVPIARFAHPYIARRGGAPPFDPWAGGSITTDYLGEVWTDGGLATTSAELARVANAMVAGPLLRKSTRRQMLRFREGGTGLGVFRYRVDGRPWVGHDGLYGGFSAQHWTDRSRKLTIAVLTNLESLPSQKDPSWEIFRRLAQAKSVPE